MSVERERHALEQATSARVNASTWTQELFEEHLGWLIPCDEVHDVLRRA